MGGLVSRACLSEQTCRDKVDHLITLGSPHAGLPAAGIRNFFGSLRNQPAEKEMSEWQKNNFNKYNFNQRGIRYLFIGGSRDWGFPSQGWLWEKFGSGPNDGLVGRNSAIGWLFPEGVFSPAGWANTPHFQQAWTDEVHSRSYSDDGNKYNDYYHPRIENGEQSYSYRCLIAWLNFQSLPSFCQSPQKPLQVQKILSDESAFGMTEAINGHLASGQVITPTIDIDTSGTTLIYLTWATGTITLTLNNPDSLLIDPDYAITHPNEVSYTSSPGSADFPAFTTYAITNTLPGTWQLNITAGDLGPEGSDLTAFALVETNLELEGDVDKHIYQVGETAILSATLQNYGVGMPGVILSATLTQPNGNSLVIPMIDQGNGDYYANYIIPEDPGYLRVKVNASGMIGETHFTRQVDLIVSIAPNEAQFTGQYDDYPRDDDANGVYESLLFLSEIEALSAGDYVLSGSLEHGGNTIAQTSVYTHIITGTQSVTLEFSGEDIYAAQLDGPYTVNDLYLIPVELGIPAQIIDNVWTTAAYQWRDFGYEYLYLPLIYR